MTALLALICLACSSATSAFLLARHECNFAGRDSKLASPPLYPRLFFRKPLSVGRRPPTVTDTTDRWSGHVSTRYSGAQQLRAACAHASQGAAFYNLVSWLRKGGGHVHSGVELVQDDRGAGRGLRVAHSIGDGELIVSVPCTHFISCQMSNHSDRTMLEGIGPNPSIRGMRLGLILLQEKLKRRDSQAFNFDPYFEMLPSSYDNLPVYYAEDIPELQFSHVEQHAVARINELLRVTKICQSLSGSEDNPFDGHLDIEQVLWAQATASSRALSLDCFSPEASSRALVPIMDLINHAFDANCRLADEGAGTVGLRAVGNIDSGEPLRLNYGNVPNDELVLDYGFVTEENPHDFVRLPAGALSYALQESVASFQRTLALEETEDFLSEEEARALSAAQLRLLHAANLSDVSTVVIMHDGVVEAKSMALVRVLVLRSPAEAAGVSCVLQVQDDTIEERARDVIRRLCTLALQQLPTSTSHDMRLVHGDGGTAGAAPDSVHTEGPGSVGNPEQSTEWDGKTRGELGPAISAVAFRLAHKHILNRAARLYGRE